MSRTEISRWKRILHSLSCVCSGLLANNVTWAHIFLMGEKWLHSSSHLPVSPAPNEFWEIRPRREIMNQQKNNEREKKRIMTWEKSLWCKIRFCLQFTKAFHAVVGVSYGTNSKCAGKGLPLTYPTMGQTLFSDTLGPISPLLKWSGCPES